MNQFQPYRFFRGMRIHHLSLLIKCASEAKYEKGEILFTAGQPAYRFFLIKSGAVALERYDTGNESGPTKMAQPGDVLGRPWSATPVRWPVTARAITPTTAIVLCGARLMACAEEYPDFGAELMKRTSEAEVDGLFAGQQSELQAEGKVWPYFHMDGDVTTVNAGKFAFSEKDTLDISLASAKKFFLHNGEPVQLTTRHGTAVFPIRIKDANQPDVYLSESADI